MKLWLRRATCLSTDVATHRIDLRDANLINSPYYYLQQNDVIYVEPNKAKAANSKTSTSTTIWFSVISSVLSLSSLIVNLVR